MHNKSKIIGIIIGIAILIVLGWIVFASKKSGEAPAQIPPTPASETAATSETPATPRTSGTPPADKPKPSASIYKDGTYTATGSYFTHDGEDRIAVTLTLKKDIITAVSVVPEPSDNISVKYQNMFLSGYKQYVIGKNISEVSLGKISGSSLTPNGFNDALAQIKAQAKA